MKKYLYSLVVVAMFFACQSTKYRKPIPFSALQGSYDKHCSLLWDSLSITADSLYEVSLGCAGGEAYKTPVIYQADKGLLLRPSICNETIDVPVRFRYPIRVDSLVVLMEYGSLFWTMEEQYFEIIKAFNAKQPIKNLFYKQLNNPPVEFPQVPREYMQYILRKPKIECMVIDSINDSTYIIDKGYKDGIVPKLHLYQPITYTYKEEDSTITETNNLHYEVVQIGAKQSTIVIKNYLWIYDSLFNSPNLGARLLNIPIEKKSKSSKSSF